MMPRTRAVGTLRPHNITPVKKSLVLCLCCTLALPPAASAYGAYGDDNPFVEAMLRMMEIFGLIDRDRLPLSVPYLPGYGPQFAPGGLGGLGGVPGMSPMYGLGGVPGMSPMYGLGGVPGMSAIPGAGGMPGGSWGNWGNLNYYPQAPLYRPSTQLDGIWELDKGGFVIIQGNVARLYLSREQYQDFAIHYDGQYLWWRPQEGGKASQYRYKAREGRMVLGDHQGNLLLMRRRR